MVDRVGNHYELECWIKPGTCWHQCTLAPPVEALSNLQDVIQRADAEILMDAQPQEAYAPRANVEGQPHFDFMVGTDMSTGAAWASAVSIKSKEDPYIASSILSWLSELGHSIVIIQSDGEPASEVVMRMVQSKGAMMENPPCEITQLQSQRYSHQSTGGAERMVQTIRN